MGIGDWFNDTMQHVEKITDDVGHMVSQGVQQAEQFMEQLGGEIKSVYEKVDDALSIYDKAAGQDPAQIFRWFHDGPGTIAYQGLHRLFTHTGGVYENVSNNVNKAKNTLGSGWSGPAAEKAQAALSGITTNFDKMQQLSQQAATGLRDQIDTFHETKGKVVPVPEKGAQIGGIPMATPAAPVVAGSELTNLVQYQQHARNNQQAYKNYGDATVPQAQSLPTELLKEARQHDTSVGNPATTSGTGTHSYQYSPGAPAGATAPQQAGAAPAPVHQSNYQAPAASAPQGGYSAPPQQGQQYVNPGATNAASAGTPVSPTTGGGEYGGPVGGGYGGSSPGESERYTSAAPYGGTPESEFTGGGVPRAAAGGLSPLEEALGGVAAGGVGAGLGAGAEGDSYKRGWRSANRAKALAGEEEPGAKTGKGVDAEEPKAGTITPKKPAEPGARSAARAMEAEERAALREPFRTGKGGPMGEEMVPPGGAGGKEEDREHKTASYLVHEENGAEIVGELPPTAPPVIGE